MTTNVSTTNLKINVLTRTQYDSSEKNNDELYFVEESETNTWLIALTDIAPESAIANDRYYNTTNKLIYTWDGSSWTNSISPSSDDLYIDKTDNSTYAWDGTDMVQIGSAGGITADDIDGTTITLNSSDKLQASGIVNKKDGDGIFNWVGTKEEYNQLEEIHDDWIYYITNDNASSGGMSLSNVYNRLNRAYAWTYRNVSGAGNVYNLYYNSGAYTVSDSFNATKVITPEDNYATMSNYMICDGKLYFVSISGTTLSRTQVESSNLWTCVSGGNTPSRTLAINDGNLYDISNTSSTLKNSGGWQKLSFHNYNNKSLGIKNDSLYLISPDVATISLIDSSGVWSQITGTSASTSTYMFGIKDGRMYSISNNGTVFCISADDRWETLSGYYASATIFGIGINNHCLYALATDRVYPINTTETWVKCCGYGNNAFALTQSGKLYKISSTVSSPLLTQIGTSTTWEDISGAGSESLGIDNGNVYLNLTSPNKITTSGGINKVYGHLYQNSSYSPALFWTGSVVEDVHTVYTVPSPQIDFHTYSDKNLTNLSTISAVNKNNNTITDNYYTYTRDSALDTIFSAVSVDSKNQLISVADLLNAIKG